MSLFFLSCYGDHRDLHSFPTRRSSDLFALAFAHAQSGLRHLGVSSEEALLFERLASRVLYADGSLRAGPDRKSTRLNSSHGYISYAVFCLKKKKTYF